MRLCRDDALMRLLNREGYQPVMTPRTNVEPPELYVLSDDDRLIRRGPLADYLPGSAALPLRRGSLLEMQQTVTSGKTASAAASFLADALRCLGVAGAPKLDLGFASSRTLTFSFTGVTYASFDPSQVDHLLPSLQLEGVPPEQIEDGRLHLAYEYAYADALLMRDTASTGAKLDFQAIRIEEVLDVGSKVQVSVLSDTTLSFKPTAGQPAVFACKIGRVERYGTAWSFYPEEKMGQGLTSNESGTVPYLIQRGAILDVEDVAG